MSQQPEKSGDGSRTMGSQGLELKQLPEKVRQLARAERRRDARLSRFARALRILALVLGLATATAILYGALTFPDAPIRATETGFVGKTGVAYSQQHYEHFKTWERALVIGFGLTFLSGIGILAEARLSRGTGIPARDS